ncbi:MAG: zinc metalloprotease HtpX [Fimbriimonadales bacterium]
MKTIKVGLLFAGLSALLVWCGSLIGGGMGAVIAFGIAVAMNVATFWFSDRLILRMTSARPVGAEDAPELFQMVDRLRTRAGLPMPRLYVIDDPSPNAFATGRSPKHAAVAVNTGLLDLLDRSEVEGVIAHELAHIKNRDTLTMTMVACLAGAISMIANFAQISALFGGGSNDEDANPIGLLLMAMVAPIAAMLIQLGISRAREYEADRIGADIAGTPAGLANALLKLERGNDAIPAHAQPSVAPLYIVNPLRGGGLAALFSTHPPIQERVRRLAALTTRRAA